MDKADPKRQNLLCKISRILLKPRFKSTWGRLRLNSGNWLRVKPLSLPPPARRRNGEIYSCAGMALKARRDGPQPQS